MKKQWKEAKLETIALPDQAIVTLSGGKNNDDEPNWGPWV